MVSFNEQVETPEEGIVYSESNIEMFLEGEAFGNGTLWITENLIIWKGTNSGKGLELNYSELSMHAVSKDKTSFPHECLLCIVEPSSENAMSRNDNEYDEVEMTYVRFVPDDNSKLQEIYDAIADCQADPEDEMDDYFGEEYNQDVHGLEQIELSEENLCDMDNMKRIVKMMSPGEFEDMVQADGGEQFDDANGERWSSENAGEVMTTLTG